METTLIDISEKFSEETFLKKNPGEHSLGTFLRNVSTLLRHISMAHSSVMFPIDIPQKIPQKHYIPWNIPENNPITSQFFHYEKTAQNKTELNRTEQNRTEQKSSNIK